MKGRRFFSVGLGFLLGMAPTAMAQSLNGPLFRQGPGVKKNAPACANDNVSGQVDRVGPVNSAAGLSTTRPEKTAAAAECTREPQAASDDRDDSTYLDKIVQLRGRLERESTLQQEFEEKYRQLRGKNPLNCLLQVSLDMRCVLNPWGEFNREVSETERLADLIAGMKQRMSAEQKVLADLVELCRREGCSPAGLTALDWVGVPLKRPHQSYASVR